MSTKNESERKWRSKETKKSRKERARKGVVFSSNDTTHNESNKGNATYLYYMFFRPVEGGVRLDSYS